MKKKFSEQEDKEERMKKEEGKKAYPQIEKTRSEKKK